MEEHGFVKEITKDEVTIEVFSKEECEKCCGCKAAKTKDVTIDRKDAKDLSLGDHVEVSLDPEILFKFFLLVYGVPMISFVSAVFIVYYISKSPIISFLAAMSATILTYFVIGWYTKKSKQFTPVVRVL